ncbi:carboxymuconolactone decarboxylase family protein [Sphingosinicella sp. LHD-64]|uniref:carboxymuconolactone decarboxylase family protein n=1 Tax=Sphingosinicella sp. LHD-64 TaxID=3072139 RepID=UPI00280DEC61|nr:carboxymuconolactone decarboxylase family protein [Sphingosinicella sp. LHD-64]MDQ8755157.1 carboxymuconolactone decarboxylase family protein [Sphingosinicella sp. LHD-64]
MTARLNIFKPAPDAIGSWVAYSQKVAADGLEPGLVHLVTTRVSQLNGCANCVNMHTREARRDGESEQRLHLLSVWREAPVFSARERAALAWAEALTMIAVRGAPDDETYAAFAEHFSEEEQVKLTLRINATSGWNRFAVGFRLFYEDRESALADAA